MAKSTKKTKTPLTPKQMGRKGGKKSPGSGKGK